MEVVISVGVIAVMVPIVLAFTVTGGKSSKVASDETRSSLLARTAAREVDSAMEGASEVIEGTLSWPEFPAGGGRIVLSASRDGEILEQLEARDYLNGVSGREVGFLISIKGAEHFLDNVTDSSGISRVEISVETPAAAGEVDRRKFVYTELMHNGEFGSDEEDEDE